MGARYLVLPRAGGNPVWEASVATLGASELRWLAHAALSRDLGEVAPTELGGVAYLAFDCAEPLAGTDAAVLANASFLHAWFLGGAGGLEPVDVVRRACLPPDLVTIQRYPGQTNGAFTHLLVNVALAAVAGGFERLLSGGALRLLDPVCGRGTTLNRAALYGMDAVGIEQSRADVEAYDRFLATWMRSHRVPHRAQRATEHRPGGRSARRYVRSYGPSGDRRSIEVVQDDAANAAELFGRRTFDLLVADLPYGVQHRGGGGARGPADLLVRALPAWAEVLKGNGAAALSWNRRTLPRDDLLALVRSVGWRPCGPPGGPDAWAHDVDRAIRRDVVVAVPDTHPGCQRLTPPPPPTPAPSSDA